VTDIRDDNLAYNERIATGGVDSILSSIFRDILLDFQIDIARFQALLERFVILENKVTNSSEISTARSSLARELLKNTMTWKVFMKALRFFRAERVMMVFRLFRGDETESTHVMRIGLKTDYGEGWEREPKLAKFYHDILASLEIDDEQLQSYLEHYTRRFHPGVNSAEFSAAKSSLRRDLAKNTMSWKVFMKGLSVIGTTRLIIDLTMYHSGNYHTNHTKSLILGEPELSNDESGQHEREETVTAAG